MHVLAVLARLIDALRPPASALPLSNRLKGFQSAAPSTAATTQPAAGAAAGHVRVSGGSLATGSRLGTRLRVSDAVSAVLARGGGLRGLFTGATARVLKRALSTAITWTLFEEAMRRGGGGGGGG